ncbi:MAG: preprotein translocase subunit SecG [Pseudomonadota bacterium]
MTMTILTVFQVLIAMAMIGIILVQRGPGAAAGSGFGAGASATVFGSSGAGSFLTRTTAILATVFFAVSLLMAVLVSNTIERFDEVDLGVMAAEEAATIPAGASDVPSMDTEDVSDIPMMPMEVPAEDGDDVPTVPGADDEATQPAPGENGEG